MPTFFLFHELAGLLWAANCFMCQGKTYLPPVNNCYQYFNCYDLKKSTRRIILNDSGGGKETKSGGGQETYLFVGWPYALVACLNYM